MNKGRLESFSDGVFSIVMTLMIFDIKLPTPTGYISNMALLGQLSTLAPLIGLYFFSFAVLSTLWVNHHFIFHTFAKSVDRRLNFLNLTYLMFVGFVPFSTYLIGTFHHNQIAAIIYGINISCIVLLAMAMVRYISRHPNLNNEHLSVRIRNQARFRGLLSLWSYLLGILATFVFPPASLFFYIFPIIFNLVPGTLDLTERIFRFSLD